MISALAGLRWRQLARVAQDARLPQAVRARAEQILAERLAKLTPGEQAALARIASRLVILSLLETRSPRVMSALLGNPRLTGTDVVAVVENPRTPDALLSAIARSERWKDCHKVKLALARRPGCPSADALRCLRGLEREDLERIAADAQVPRLVRLAAHRRVIAR